MADETQENVETFIDANSGNKALMLQLATSATRAINTGADTYEKTKSSGFLQRLKDMLPVSSRKRFEQITDRQDRAEAELSEIKACAFAALKVLNERECLTAEALITVKNNLNSLAVEQNELKQAIREVVDRVADRFERLETRISNVEASQSLNMWIQNLEDEDYDKLPKAVRFLKVVKGFYTRKQGGYTLDEVKSMKRALRNVGIDPKKNVTLGSVIDELVLELESFDEAKYDEIVRVDTGTGNAMTSKALADILPVPSFVAVTQITETKQLLAPSVDDIMELQPDLQRDRALMTVIKNRIKRENGIDLNTELTAFDLAVELLSCYSALPELCSGAGAEVTASSSQLGSTEDASGMTRWSDGSGDDGLMVISDESEFKCDINGGIVTINGLAGDEPDRPYKIVIPQMVKGYPVTVIKDDAFAQHEKLVSVEMPSGIKLIDSGAFHGCGISSVTIPDGVKVIGFMAFHECPNLKTVVIQYGIRKIGGYAFSDNPSLTSVTIPNGVRVLEDNAFEGCNNLSEDSKRSISEATQHYDYDCVDIIEDENDFRYRIKKGKASVTGFVYGEPDWPHKIVIPEEIAGREVIAIGDEKASVGAFYLDSNLTAVDISDSIQVIRAAAFCCCRNLVDVTIPSYAEMEIADTAFDDCTSLSEESKQAIREAGYTGSFVDDDDSSGDDSDSGDDAAYSNDYQEEEVDMRTKIAGIVDKYLPDIAKDNMWYRSKGCSNPENRDVINNVRQYIAPEASLNDIVGFIDVTVFGKGKNGLVFTTDTLHEKAPGYSIAIPYAMMSELELEGKDLAFPGCEGCGKGLQGGGVTPNIGAVYYNTVVLKDCLEEIRAAVL